MCDFFFFKQKTAYEMRISDWSSDVCSSDLFRSNRLPIALAATAGIAWLLREPIKEHVPRLGRRLRDLADGAIDRLRPGAADTHDDTDDTADSEPLMAEDDEAPR